SSPGPSPLLGCLRLASARTVTAARSSSADFILPRHARPFPYVLSYHPARRQGRIPCVGAGPQGPALAAPHPPAPPSPPPLPRPRRPRLAAGRAPGGPAPAAGGGGGPGGTRGRPPRGAPRGGGGGSPGGGPPPAPGGGGGLAGAPRLPRRAGLSHPRLFPEGP